MKNNTEKIVIELNAKTKFKTALLIVGLFITGTVSIMALLQVIGILAALFFAVFGLEIKFVSSWLIELVNFGSKFNVATSALCFGFMMLSVLMSFNRGVRQMKQAIKNPEKKTKIARKSYFR